MKRQIVAAILVSFATLALSLVVMEASVRMIGGADANGQFVFRNTKLPPYVLPLDDLKRQIQEYLENKEAATLIPDDKTGWTYRPNSKRQNGEFTINGAGMRSLREYTLRAPSDTLRIALFGDSFVAGDEVKDEEAWGSLLEQQLNQAGLRSEVLNSGVGGYSIGQAYLRWQSQGKQYDPDIVIFVFQAENLDRNVNVFRILYPQGGVVYSKPRFIFEDGKLTLLNSPAIPPEELVDVFDSFDSHPLAKHEAYYISREYTSPLWRVSKLAGLAHIVLNRLGTAEAAAQDYGPDSERGRLGKAIADAFASDVVESGARFIILYLPRFDHFRAFHEGKLTPWQFLLDHFDAAYHFISAEDFLSEEYTADSYYQPFGHYGPAINATIADAVAGDLQTCIEGGACALSRFDNHSAFMTDDVAED